MRNTISTALFLIVGLSQTALGMKNPADLLKISEVIDGTRISNIDYADLNGCTSLLAACFASYSDTHLETVRMLLKLGANINHKDHMGWTALHCAVVHNNPKIAKLLIDNGAEIDLKNESQLSAFDLALSEGHDEISKLITVEREKRAEREEFKILCDGRLLATWERENGKDNPKALLRFTNRDKSQKILGSVKKENQSVLNWILYFFPDSG